jgi:hypothetical protein
MYSLLLLESCSYIIYSPRLFTYKYYINCIRLYIYNIIKQLWPCFFFVRPIICPFFFLDTSVYFFFFPFRKKADDSGERESGCLWGPPLAHASQAAHYHIYPPACVCVCVCACFKVRIISPPPCSLNDDQWL